MISPFGVEHGYPVSKSFSRGVFKPITQMTTKQRGNILGSYKKARGVSRSDKRWLAGHNAAKEQVKEAVAEQGGSHKLQLDRDFPSMGAGTYRVGGKKTGKSTVIGNVPTKSLMNYVGDHENAHASVPRTSYRLHNQLSDPVKSMREEARADWVADGHYSRHSKKHGSGYAEAARAQEKAEKHPNRPMIGSKKNKGLIGFRLTNQHNYEGARNGLASAAPNYGLEGAKGDRAIRAYRDLHDSMRAKGVPQPKKKRPWQKPVEDFDFFGDDDW